MTIVFTQNPLRNSISYNDNELLKLCKTSAECFSDLPSYHLGESKDIRRTKEPGILIQKFLPTLNSITEKRKGIVLKSDSLRLDISTVFWEALHTENIPTCYLARHEAYVLMTEENLPPVEVIVKACLIGTPAKLYDGLFHLTDRFGKKFIAGETHPPYVRFDYRNPLINAKGIYLRDECMPISFADRFINTQKADSNALTIFQIIQDRLNRINLQVLDCCLLFDETGSVFCSEISPDNMRIKSLDWHPTNKTDDDFDKDLWRKGMSDDIIIKQWVLLLNKLTDTDK